MTAVNITYGTPQSYGFVSSLASPNYDYAAGAYVSNGGANKPIDVLFEYSASVAANSTGNKQISLFVQGSLDGTTWAPLPVSATDTTHDTSMIPLGSVPTNGGTGVETTRTPRPFSIAAAFGGILPPYWRVIQKNDCGVALSSISARTTEVYLSGV